MAQYGELIGAVVPLRDSVYDAFATYYNNPVMTKTEFKEDCAIYMARIQGLLGVQQRYLVAIVRGDRHPVNTTSKLRALEWDSFQALTLEKKTLTSTHFYTPRKGTPLDDEIVRVKKDIDRSVYHSAKSGLEIVLSRAKGMSGQFQDKGSVASALETYNTVITFRD